MKKLKFKEWDGKSLKGEWTFSIKIDGIRLEKLDDGTIVTRNGKPVYNLPRNVKKFEVAEVCCDGNWNSTMSIVRASKSARRKVRPSEIHSIVPLDPRLKLCKIKDPDSDTIRYHFDVAREHGYEGLVLYNKEKDLYIKVKDKYTVDVRITGFVESDAKTKGTGYLKEFITEKGKVGTGITRQQCKEFWNTRDELLNTFIEVEVMEMTASGKFRNPRFVRLRPDKS